MNVLKRLFFTLFSLYFKKPKYYRHDFLIRVIDFFSFSKIRVNMKDIRSSYFLGQKVVIDVNPIKDFLIFSFTY